MLSMAPHFIAYSGVHILYYANTWTTRNRVHTHYVYTCSTVHITQKPVKLMHTQSTVHTA